jgi:crossover junction endodeoxyribonuclease RuvC
MKILGIDPGMATTGWGVIQKNGSDGFAVVRHGCFLTPAGQPLAGRLRLLAGQLRELIAREKPVAAAVEELYFAKDSRSAASVGHARGVILLVLSDLGLPVFEYNPRQVKMALTGFGAADKSQVQRMVQRLLSLSVLPRPDDAADALAIALCHLNSVGLSSRIRSASPEARLAPVSSDMPPAPRPVFRRKVIG